MSVYKRYKGRRLKPGDSDWDKGKWWMEFRLRGQDIHESVPGARTKQQAERAESSVRESIYDGKYNKVTKTSEFSTFFDEVYMPWAKANKASWPNDESRGKLLKSFFGDLPLRHITPLLIRKFKAEVLSGKTQKGTLRRGTTWNRYRSLLSKTFEIAFEEELVDLNPVRRVPKEPDDGARDRYLTYEEEARLLPVLKGSKLSHLYSPVVIDIDTGLRIYSELLKLEIQHVNLTNESRFFQVNGKDIELRPNHLLVVKSKSRKPRTVPLTERARKEFVRVIQGRTVGYVFESHRTGVSYASFEGGFKKACQLAKIPHGQSTPNGITLHTLRHTFATRLQERGVHPYTIMALMGHSSVKMTSTYSHSTPDTKEAAIERLGGCGDVLSFSLRQKSANGVAEATSVREAVSGNG